MRTLLFATAALLAAGSVPVLAQTPDQPAAPDAGTATGTPAATDAVPAKPVHHRRHTAKAASDGETFAHEPGTGESGPASMKASNIDQATTHSDIGAASARTARRPEPPAGATICAMPSVRWPCTRTGMAQQALEMAETRLLDRSTPMDMAGQPASNPIVQHVSEARRDLAGGNVKGTREAIALALAAAPQPDEGDQGAMASPGMAPGAGTGSGSQMGMSQPGGAPMGNGMPTSGMMAPSGAGPTPGDTAGARVGGGPAGTGTADSAGGAK